MFEPNNTHRQLAADVGLHQGRRLIQLRRPLPLDDSLLAEIDGFPVENFVVGQDEAEWVSVNNAAFAHHPEQGGWTIDTVRSREQEPWFDARGFVVHRDNGKMTSFCWTKVHSDTEPKLGEIYVIAVHPQHAGRGLGRKMAIAGLARIPAPHIPVAMLYVDSDNSAALSLYASLGFTPHHEEHAFIGDITPLLGSS